MTKTKFLFWTLFYSLILLIYTSIALKLHLFFVSNLLDAPSHILGGFVSMMFLAYFSYVFLQNKSKKYHKIFLFIGVLIIGILWEIFELKFHLTSLKKSGFWTDTNADIVCDLFGALLAYTYYIKRFYARE